MEFGFLHICQCGTDCGSFLGSIDVHGIWVMVDHKGILPLSLGEVAFVLDAKAGAEVDEILLVLSSSIHPIIPVLGTFMFDDVSDAVFWETSRELVEVPFFILVKSCLPG